jgi:hypothetical protein
LISSAKAAIVTAGDEEGEGRRAQRKRSHFVIFCPIQQTERRERRGGGR